MSNISNKTTQWFVNAILYLAFILLIAGILTFVYFVWDYNHAQRNFKNGYDITDLGTILTGTVGLFWSLSGILFFAYNLNQQKETILLQQKELKHANDTASVQQKAISEQTSNNFFFNLLENNKKLISLIEINNINALISHLKDSARIYLQGLMLNTFDSFKQTNSEPTYTINHTENANMITPYIANVIDIISFIDLKLEGDHFFHRMFFNQLSHSEKYLISFCFHKKLFGFEKIIPSFDYSEVYINDNSRYDMIHENGEVYYFPAMSIVTHHGDATSDFSVTNFLSPGFKMQLFVNDNFLGLPIKLIGVKIDIENYGNTTLTQIHEYLELDQLPKKRRYYSYFEVDLDKYLKNILLNWDKKSAFNTNMTCNLKFTFEYGDDEYDVLHYNRIIFSVQKLV